MVALAKISFDKTQSVTYERYKLFNRAQKTGETLEAFQAALTAQAARAELGTLENELVRDLFISKMKNTALQDTLTFETFTPDAVLKRAMKFEQSKQTTQAFQKSNTIATGASQVDGTMKKKTTNHERGKKSTNSRRQPREQYKRRATDRKYGRNYTETKPCTRCGRPFGEGHLKKCPAIVKLVPNRTTLQKCAGHNK